MTRPAALLVVAMSALAGAGCDSGRGKTTPNGLAEIEFVKRNPIAGFDRTFTWKPIDGATSYRLVVFNGDGARAFEVRDLTVPGVKLAEKLNLPPGRYLAQASAWREADMIGESQKMEFEIK